VGLSSTISGASEGNVDGLVSTVMTEEVHVECGIVDEPPSPAHEVEQGDHGAYTTRLEAAALVKVRRWRGEGRIFFFVVFVCCVLPALPFNGPFLFLRQEYETKMAAQLDVIFRQQETIRRQEEEINDLRRRLAVAGL
jgi:hypothetical protein